MTDYIKREDAQDIIARKLSDYITDEERWILEYVDGEIGDIPSADVRENITAHKVIGGGERDGATCWFECDNCGLAVDIGDVFCKHCGARFEP